MSPQRSHIFYEFTRALCSKCLKTIDAKIVFQNEKVYMLKHCLEHGEERVLIATDIEYYKSQKDYYKPWDQCETYATETIHGCPHDCGICPDHEQHACLSIVEITDKCNLTCPVCFAHSDPTKAHKSLEEIEHIFDTICAHEAEPDVVQISWGEPTIHPDFFEILDRAKARPFRYLMINTNGIRIAQDEEFVRKLQSYQPNFEIYLQFDSFDSEYLRKLRWADLTEIRMKAIENLNKYDISTTLVVVVEKGKNEKEIGKILDFASQQKCIRGVTFQPVQAEGRIEWYNPETERLTLTEVRQAILDQFPLFESRDIVPLPCHPENIAMGYALKWDWQMMPLGRYIDRDELLKWAENTIIFERNPEFKKHFFDLFSLSKNGELASNCFSSLLCCLPKVAITEKLGYKNVFRILIISFMDRYDLDLRSVKRSCIMFPREDGKLYPFDTFNLFYRAKYERKKRIIWEKEKRKPSDEHHLSIR